MPLTFQNTHSSLSRGRTTLGHRNHIRQPPRPCLVLHPAQPSLHQAHATLGAIDVNQLSGLVLITLESATAPISQRFRSGHFSSGRCFASCLATSETTGRGGRSWDTGILGDEINRGLLKVMI